jgi:hypothetical protein
MRHGPRRAWLTPWRKKCRCGCAWYPCPDTATAEPPPVTLSLRGQRDMADWNTPTKAYGVINPADRALMTPGQRWRSRS